MSVDGIHLIISPIDAAGGEAVAHYAWWKVMAGRIVQYGRDSDVLAASGFTQGAEPDRVTLLLSNDDAAVRVHRFADITPQQAIAAAQAEALNAAIDADDDMHSAAALFEHSSAAIAAVSAVVRKSVLQTRLTQLQDMGLTPDHVVPAATLMPLPDSGYACFVLADHDYLLGQDLAAADDRALRQALLIDQEPELLDEDRVHAALADLPSAHSPDLRHGAFAKQMSNAYMTPVRAKWLAGMAAALLIITLLIPAVRLWIYSSAEDAAISAVLPKVQADFPAATDLDTARNLVDDALARRGAGASIFSVPAAALLRALEESNGIVLQDLAYQPGGVIAARISAENTENVRLFMEGLQINQGFTLTCQQCDQPSQTVFDITVRG